MSAAGLRIERTRNGLSEVILGELESWPDLHRRIFVQSHYRGQSLDEVSLGLGLSASEVRLILEQCERRLRQALKAFRESRQDADSSPQIRPPMVTSGGYLY